MLHFIFDFFQQYRFWIYMLIALVGFIIFFVAEHLRKKELKAPGSVKQGKQVLLALYIAALILLIGVMIAFFLDGYYDPFINWILGR